MAQICWYGVKCKPRQDFRALENLERQGFSCYLPVLSVERLRHGRMVETSEALFPGYLFIQLDNINGNWWPIRSTRGVSQIVCFNDRPLPIQEEIIERIRERLPVHDPPVRYLKRGERVRIVDGCFSGIEAIFVAHNGTQRVMLLMEILQHEQILSFPVGVVRKCRDL